MHDDGISWCLMNFVLSGTCEYIFFPPCQMVIKHVVNWELRLQFFFTVFLCTNLVDSCILIFIYVQFGMLWLQRFHINIFNVLIYVFVFWLLETSCLQALMSLIFHTFRFIIFVDDLVSLSNSYSCLMNTYRTCYRYSLARADWSFWRLPLDFC